MAGEEWSRRLRAALAAWAIASAVMSPLITAYKFLSAHSLLVPAAPESAGTLTIIVNMCVLTTLVMVFGFFTGCLFAQFSSRESWRRTIGITILACILALAMFSGSAPLLGALISLAVLLSLSPMGPWNAEHPVEVTVVWGTVFVLLLFLNSSWMEFLWQGFSEQSHFTFIPLSQMRLAHWIAALVGLGVYVGAFVVFQQWRTGGKWLKEIEDRFRHSS